MSVGPLHRVFSYGTLRQANVQKALYGHEVQTTSDSLSGWSLSWIPITDQEVIAASGSDRHPILRRGDENDSVSGAFLTLTEEELKATDDYEVTDYIRLQVTLDSGVQAFVYVANEID